MPGRKGSAKRGSRTGAHRSSFCILRMFKRVRAEEKAPEEKRAALLAALKEQFPKQDDDVAYLIARYDELLVTGGGSSILREEDCRVRLAAAYVDIYADGRTGRDLGEFLSDYASAADNTVTLWFRYGYNDEYVVREIMPRRAVDFLRLMNAEVTVGKYTFGNFNLKPGDLIYPAYDEMAPLDWIDWGVGPFHDEMDFPNRPRHAAAYRFYCEHPDDESTLFAIWRGDA